MYGGLQLAMGILFVRAAASPANIMLGLIVLVTLIGGLALGRAFGLLVNGPTEYNLGAVVYETLTLLAGIVSIRLIARETSVAAAAG